MYFRKFLLIGTLLAIGLTRAEEARVIDFSMDNSLKKVFDSGLRPYRALGLETVRLRLDDTVTSVILPEGITLKEMRWESIKLTVIKPGLVSSMEFRSGPLSVDSARAAVLEFAGSEKNRPRLEEFLSAVSKDPLLFEGEFDLSLANGGNPTRSVALSRRGVPGKPLALDLYLVWRSKPPQEGSKFYSEPIPPPPGYENVPMHDRRFPDLLETHQNSQISLEESVGRGDSSADLRAGEIEGVDSKEGQGQKFPWFLLVIVGLVFFVFCAFVFRKRHTYNL